MLTLCTECPIRKNICVKLGLLFSKSNVSLSGSEGRLPPKMKYFFDIVSDIWVAGTRTDTQRVLAYATVDNYRYITRGPVALTLCLN